jgi:sirohydrochlorin cobaltochelatase
MKRGITLLGLLLCICCIGFAHGNKKEPRTGILLVTFGTSYPKAQKAFDNIEEEVKKAFPSIDIRWAYTSKMIRTKLKKRGQHIDSPSEALAKMGEEGFTHVAVQSLHIIPGMEFENLNHTVEVFNGMPKGIEVAKLGTPLLYDHEDNQRLAEILSLQLASTKGKRNAVLMMGHGSEHAANIYYPGFQYYLDKQAFNCFLGTVEGYPLLEDVLGKMDITKIQNVTLTPFMSVAGDHALNDMGGEEADSWKSQLLSKGLKVNVIQKGLAEYDEVVAIWIDHLKEVFEEIK